MQSIPPEQLARNASDGMLLFTAILSICISMILLYLGKKGKQMWLVAWSIGLLICSVAMAGYFLLK